MTERDPPGSPGQGFLYPRLRAVYEGVTCWTCATPNMRAAQSIPTLVLTALRERDTPRTAHSSNPVRSLTTELNERLRPIHNQMPVIPSPASYDQWLDPTHANTQNL